MAGDNNSALLDALERFGLAALGAVALTAERADALADELAKAGGMRRDETREVIEQATRRWRGEAVRIGEKTGAGLEGVFRQLGLVTRAEHVSWSSSSESPSSSIASAWSKAESSILGGPPPPQ